MTEQHPIAPTHPVGAAAARAQAVGRLRERTEAVNEALGALGDVAETSGGFVPEVMVQLTVVVGEVAKLAAATGRIVAELIEGGLTVRVRTRE